MRNNPFVLMAAVFVYSCQPAEKPADEVYNDLFNDNLKGDVVTVERTPYLVDSSGKMGDMDTCCIIIDEYRNGYIANSSEKKSSGEVKSTTEFAHHDNGLMKEMINKEGGKMEGKLQIAIDAAGVYTTAVHYDSTGNIDVFYNTLSQDKYGNVIAGKQYNADSSLKSSWSSTYKDQYFVGNETKDSTGKVTYSSTGTLNDKGDMVELKWTSTTKDSTINSTVKYQYNKYDDNGNWVERLVMEEGKPTKLQTRTITYAKKE